MATLTSADVRQMWRAAYRPRSANKAAIKTATLPDPVQRAAVFQAVEDWYESLSQAKKDEAAQVQVRALSAAKQRLQDLRAVLRSLRDEHEATLDTLTTPDPLKPLRQEVRAAVVTAQALVDAEPPSLSRQGWWTDVRGVVRPLLTAAYGSNVPAAIAKAYTFAWMEVRFGDA